MKVGSWWVYEPGTELQMSCWKEYRIHISAIVLYLFMLWPLKSHTLLYYISGYIWSCRIHGKSLWMHCVHLCTMTFKTNDWKKWSQIDPVTSIIFDELFENSSEFLITYITYSSNMKFSLKFTFRMEQIVEIGTNSS